MLFVIYLAWMSPTYCNSRQNVFDAYVLVSVEKLLISNITYRSCSLTDKNAKDHDQL